MMKIMNYDNRIKVKARNNLIICYEKDKNQIKYKELNQIFRLAFLLNSPGA